ncbi:MAG: Nif3-like dinuclear metal center hexameric protein [Candidatus Thorarchaeota archaeon]
MLFKEIKNILEKRLSPKKYLINGENYGLQYGQANNEKNIKRILLTVDLNFESIHFAILNKVNLIISYNRLITYPIRKFNNLLIKKLTLLSKYPILIFPLNSALIAAEGGISDTIMEILYLQLDKVLDIKHKNKNIIPVGRICSPKLYSESSNHITLENLLKRIKSNFMVDSLSFVGDLKSEVKKICIVGSEIKNSQYLKKAYKDDCDCFISSTINSELARLAKDFEMKLIIIPIYSILNITLKRLTHYLSLEFPYDEFLYFEVKEPIKIYN